MPHAQAQLIVTHGEPDLVVSGRQLVGDAEDLVGGAYTGFPFGNGFAR